MTFRLLLVFALSILPAAGYAADCVSVRESVDRRGHPEWKISPRSNSAVRRDCGFFSTSNWSLDDPRPRVDVGAAYATFVTPINDPPRHFDDDELRFNEWVEPRNSAVSKSTPGPGTNDVLAIRKFAILSLYRSKRLLSALGADYRVVTHPSLEFEGFNYDVKRGAELNPETLTRPDAVAEFCYRQSPPLQRVYVSSDRLRPIVLAARNWSFSESGARVEFGSPSGYADGPVSCKIDNDDLVSMVQPGVTLPL